MMQAFIRFTIRFRWFVLIGIALVTIAAGVKITQGVVASSIGGLFLAEYPAYYRYLELAKEFGSDDVIVVAMPNADLLTPQDQERLDRVVTAISELPTVINVRCVLDAQRVRAKGDQLQIKTYAELLQSKGDRTKILKELAGDDLVKDLLVSEDGLHTAVIVELDTDAERPVEKTPQLIQNILSAFEQAGYQRLDLHVVGLSANIAAIMKETYFSLGRLFPFVLIMLLLSVWLMFRHLWPVVISGLVALIAVIWTMGFAVLLDRHISIFIGFVPGMILIISFSDVIHLMNAYLLELGQGLDKEQAVVVSGSEVGAACMFTSVTTFVGFITIALVPTPASRQLGLVLGFGTGIALLIAVTLAPILFILMPQPKIWRRGATGRVQGHLDRLLVWISGFTRRRPWAIIGAFTVLVIIILAGLMRLTIETDFAKRMDHDHPLRVDGRYFLEHFAGSNTFNIYLSSPEKNGLLKADVFARIVKLQREIEHLADVDQVYSLVNLMESLHRQLVPEQPDLTTLPSDSKALAQYLLLFEMSGGQDLERLVDFDRQTMLMKIHLPREEFRHTAQVGQKALALAETLFDGEITTSPSGIVYLLGRYFEIILAEQKMALLLVFLGISLMMIIGLRSLRVGLVSMVPNLLPLMAMAGYLGLAWDYVDSDILIVAMIAIGIGVDDTIHFLKRYRMEFFRCGQVEKSLQQTFAYSGRGIVITTIILVIGFAPFSLSDYLTIDMLGTLLPFTLVVALLADIFLVPAMIQLGWIRFSLQTNR